MKRLDLAGYKKGELTVIGYSHSHVQPSGQKRAIWDVVCSCGVKKQISTTNLLHGATVSCGHVLKEQRHTFRLLPNNQAEKNYLYLSYVHAAKNRKIKFNLTKEKFLEIIGQDCFYCGQKPSNERKTRSKKGVSLMYNGIDRAKSSGCYEDGNVVPCCAKCNFMKRDMDLNEFIEQAERIVSHVKKRL
jgi:hypothetical protein